MVTALNMKNALRCALVGLGALACGVASADQFAASNSFILDLDDLSYDLSRWQEQSITGLEFVGPAPIPVDVSIATSLDFDLTDAEIPSITTNVSSSYVLSPSVAARFTYLNQLNADGQDRNLLQMEAALNTNCMGRFDIVGELDADQGFARLKQITWHIPGFHAC